MLELSRAQILAFRRGAGALDELLPRSARSLRVAAWAPGIEEPGRVHWDSWRSRMSPVAARS